MTSDPQLFGHSLPTDRLRAEIEAASRSDAAVLIEGETGVGKDVAARLLHRMGRRSAHRFIAVNCAGLPDALLESELFGHVRGSFTGAYRDKLGLAALADGGTLFLDEVGEMSLRMQAMLLRFTESGEIHPVGSDRLTRTVDVRLIAATNRRLAERVSSGDFRSDLYFRLNVVRIVVPPLRERDGDLAVLLNQFLNDFARLHSTRVPTFTASALDALAAYSWPGNIRELRNFAEQIVVKYSDRQIDRADLPAHLAGRADHLSPQAADNVDSTPRPAADRAWAQMIDEGLSFWTAVYDVFLDRELTKSDIRYIIRRGLQKTRGSYRQLNTLFHMAPREHRRFLAFLYQYDCQVASTPRAVGSDEEPLAKAK